MEWQNCFCRKKESFPPSFLKKKRLGKSFFFPIFCQKKFHDKKENYYYKYKVVGSLWNSAIFEITLLFSKENDTLSCKSFTITLHYYGSHVVSIHLVVSNMSQVLFCFFKKWLCYPDKIVSLVLLSDSFPFLWKNAAWHAALSVCFFLPHFLPRNKNSRD